MLKFEFLIKNLAGNSPERDLGQIWKKAADLLISESNSSNDQITRTLMHIFDQEKPQGKIFFDSHKQPEHLIAHLMDYIYSTKSEKIRNELEDLIYGLKHIDDADPELQSSVNEFNESLGKDAKDEFQLDKLNELLSKPLSGQRLSPDRKKRINKIIDILQKTIQRESISFELSNNLTELEQDYKNAKKELLDLYRAQKTAQLEIKNHYDEKVHRDYFKSLSLMHLDEESQDLLKPSVCFLRSKEMQKEDKVKIFDLLVSEKPYKVIIELSQMLHFDSADSSLNTHWLMQIGKMTINLPHVDVLQFPMSRIYSMQDDLINVLSSNHTALIIIYKTRVSHRNPNPYLYNASSIEARVCPLLSKIYTDNRMDSPVINKNPGIDSDWCYRTLSIKNKDKAEDIEITFTPAHFLFASDFYNHLFYILKPEEEHNLLLPLQEFIREPKQENIPYILVTNQQGEVRKAIVSRPVCEWNATVLDSWKYLQQLSGIDNSFINQQIDQAKNDLETQTKQETAKIIEEYEQKLADKNDTLTEDIIGRIAAGLLSGSFEQVADFTVEAKKEIKEEKEPVKEPEKTEKEELLQEEEKEDEIGGFDDPYIDTPLCTSCNECRNINSELFAYDANKQAYIKDASAGTFKDLVMAAEKCPVRIIHPGKPKNPDEPGLDELIKKAEKFN